MAKPLSGVRVLDMGTFITGPAAGPVMNVPMSRTRTPCSGLAIQVSQFFTAP